jgi:hypothetical protein
MPPTELAELVKSTLEQARLRARADVLDLVTADVSPGMARLMRGEADVADVLPAEPFMPDVVRDYVQSGRPPGAPGPIELPGPGTLLKGDPDGR